MRGIYLGAFQADHPLHDIVYQDINGKRDIGGDMMQVDLSCYDFVVATPPCNFWSRANNFSQMSDYARATGHLLPSILHKLCSLNKPFIVENVINIKRMSEYGVFNVPCFVYFVGRHTYFTNVLLCLEGLVQPPKHISYLTCSKRQGGDEVHEVVEIFLDTIGA